MAGNKPVRNRYRAPAERGFDTGVLVLMSWPDTTTRKHWRESWPVPKPECELLHLSDVTDDSRRTGV